MQTRNKQIPFREFTSNYKLIRKCRDNHLGEHMLMKNAVNKRRVIVKNHQCGDREQLLTIIGDYESLSKMHEQSEYICAFIGYSLQQSSGILSINLIYDYEKSTLEEQVNSMVLKKQTFYEKELDTFITCSLKALTTLEKYGLNHQCLKYSNILVEGRGTIQLSYRILYTPYLTSAPTQIKQSRCSIEDYNLSEKQIESINTASSTGYNTVIHSEPTFADRLRIDKQSLGVFALRLATLNFEEVASKNSHGIYTINDRNQLTWDLEQLKSRMDIITSNYSSELTKKIEYLIFDRTFYAFRDMPDFLTNKIDVGYGHGRNSRVRHSGEKAKSHYRSKSPQTYSSHKKFGQKLALSKLSSPSELQHSRVSAMNQANTNTKMSVYRLRVQSVQNSREKQNGRGTNSGSRFSPGLFDSASPSHTYTHTECEMSASKQRADRYASMRSELETELNLKMEELGASTQTVTGQDGSQYIGTLLAGQRNGWGICYYAQGDVYAGQWKNNTIEGVGTYLFQNCDIYKGQVSNGLKHGRGKYQYFNGNYYEGEWKHDRKNGFGFFCNQQKHEQYEGNWVNGIKQGQGRYSWKNGDQYQGQFSNNLKSGSGVATKRDGTIVKGQWYGDNFKGVAAIKFKSGGSCTGNVNIKNNNADQIMAIHGKSNHVFSDGTNFSGQYNDNIRCGHVNKVQFPNGDIYCGAMKSNKFEGEGTYYYKQTNFTYKGGWQNGLQSGLGCLVLHGVSQKDTVIECMWNQGRPANKGKILYGNGDLYEGEIGRLGRNGKGIYCRVNGQKIQGTFKNGIFLSQKS